MINFLQVFVQAEEFFGARSILYNSALKQRSRLVTKKLWGYLDFWDKMLRLALSAHTLNNQNSG